MRRQTLPRDVEGKRRTLILGYSQTGAVARIALERPGSDDEPIVERIAYDAKGQRSFVAYGNATMTRYAYDPATRRLVRLRTERFSKPSDLVYRPAGPAHQDLAYAYDVSGNVLQIRDRTPGCGIAGTQLGPDELDRHFAYDPLYRLRSATGRECDVPPPVPWDAAPRCADMTRTRAYTESYQYDAIGGLTELKHHGGATRTYEAAADTNRLRRMTAGSDAIDYGYDAAGGLVGEGLSRHFESDHVGRLTRYRTQAGDGPPSVVAEYLYDTASQRVKKVVRAGGKLTVTTRADGGFERRRTSGVGQAVQNDTIQIADELNRVAELRIGPAFRGDATPALTYQLSDHLRSSQVVTDTSGAPVRREEYAPYGETTFGGQALKRYRYNGKERDEETGLYFYGQRFYSPWLGRWTSPDPAGFVDGLHLYCFIADNPMRLIDPSGSQSLDSSGGVPPPNAANVPASTESSGQGSAGGTITAAAPAPAPATPAPPTIDVHDLPDAGPQPDGLSPAEKESAGQQRAAFERSRAARNAHVGRDVLSAVAPGVFPPPAQLQGVPPGIAQMASAAAQEDVAVAGGEVAKAILENGVTAATFVADVGAAGLGAGAQIAGRAAVKETAQGVSADLVARAKEIDAALGGGRQTTVAVSRAVIDGTTYTVVTVNDKRAYGLLARKVVPLAEHEILGDAPTKLFTRLRRYWNNTNLHAEELGIRTLKRMGATSGEVATSRLGCDRCQNIIKTLNGITGDQWTHLNPDPNVIIRPNPRWR